MSGLQEVACHIAAHAAQSDKSEVSHCVLSPPCTNPFPILP
jgi:hypothetical protein